jgi:hypothetical protein
MEMEILRDLASEPLSVILAYAGIQKLDTEIV